MNAKLFGTDGIRGRAGDYPMTAGMAMKIAMATAAAFRARHQNTTGRVLIGKDTRLSGYMLEEAMCAGFVAMGLDVVLTGPVPTPAVSMLTRSLRADIGVMISASHNPYTDNGIKLFGADGTKLADEMEAEIEQRVAHNDLENDMPGAEKFGKASRLEDERGRYIEFLKGSLPRGRTLDGLKVVVDAAHGAAYKIAPQLLWEMEAEVITMGNTPNGRNINDGVGATAPQALCARVVETGADIGIALDGDADRLIISDEKGNVVDGDQIIALLATAMKAEKRLAKDTVVTTVMSNLGLEKYLEQNGMHLRRTSVGDRHVVLDMRKGGYSLGGEQSGHIILGDIATTGDGLLCALHVLSHLKESGKKASELLSLFTPYPQVLKNVEFKAGTAPLEQAKVKQAISKAEQDMAGEGRLLVRASGTEPLIRVMAEGKNRKTVEKIVDRLCKTIKAA